MTTTYFINFLKTLSFNRRSLILIPRDPDKYLKIWSITSFVDWNHIIIYIAISQFSCSFHINRRYIYTLLTLFKKKSSKSALAKSMTWSNVGGHSTARYCWNSLHVSGDVVLYRSDPILNETKRKIGKAIFQH